MVTLRVAMDDSAVMSVVLKEGPTPVNLSAATAIQLDLVNASTGTVDAEIECVFTPNTTGTVSVPCADLPQVRAMYICRWKITNSSDKAVRTLNMIPDMGLWVY